MSADQDFALGQNLVLLRADGTTIYPPFLRWLVQGPEWWEQIQKFLNVGAVFDSLKCADVPKFELHIPPLNQQLAIAHILGTLDDRIELTRRMNETLEAMARAIFQSWLMNSHPIRAKANDLIRADVLEIGDGYRAKNSELGETGVPFIRAGNLDSEFDTVGADLLCDDSLARLGARCAALETSPSHPRARSAGLLGSQSARSDSILPSGVLLAHARPVSVAPRDLILLDAE